MRELHACTTMMTRRSCLCKVLEGDVLDFTYPQPPFINSQAWCGGTLGRVMMM